jgi:hypothetical protein
MSEDERRKQDAQTYCRRDLGHGYEQEPDDTLNDISTFVSIRFSECRRDRTCVRSRRTKLNVRP